MPFICYDYEAKSAILILSKNPVDVIVLVRAAYVASFRCKVPVPNMVSSGDKERSTDPCEAVVRGRTIVSDRVVGTPTTTQDYKIQNFRQLLL
jgi:hypothetical protein